MTHFARTRPSWNDGDIPLGADFEDLDSKTARALNADDGGSWSPSSPIVIGGQGVQIAGEGLHVTGKGIVGRPRVDITVAGPNSSATYTADATRLVTLGSNILADQSYTLSATNALEGDQITVAALPTLGSTPVVTILDQASASLIKLGNTANADSPWADFVYTGSAWKLARSAKRTEPRLVQIYSAWQEAFALPGSGSSVLSYYEFTVQSGDTLHIHGLLDFFLSTDAVKVYLTRQINGGSESDIGRPIYMTQATRPWQPNTFYNDGNPVFPIMGHFGVGAARTARVNLRADFLSGAHTGTNRVEYAHLHFHHFRP
jgi:hypothetical protein